MAPLGGKAFSPAIVNIERGFEFEGAIASPSYLLFQLFLYR